MSVKLRWPPIGAKNARNITRREYELSGVSRKTTIFTNRTTKRVIFNDHVFENFRNESVVRSILKEFWTD